jgi:hypothetical protein
MAEEGEVPLDLCTSVVPSCCCRRPLGNEVVGVVEDSKFVSGE